MDSSSLIGQKLGKYEIIELLGKGGMATVYKGFQEGVDRYVAIKVLPPHPGQDTQFINRFQQEARTIARLQHPHILPVYDYGMQDNILYLATAYVEGGALSDLIRRGPMPLAEVDKLLRQTSSALDYAHRQGIIHRDIKPDNILINAEGYVLLADFGIAKLAKDSANITATGAIVGTPAYMAPEQGQGLTIDAAADIYALGVVVYEMLTGQQPFTADTPIQVVIKHMTEPAPRLTDVMSGLPPALEAVMQRVLAKDPEARYETATEFAEAFSQAIGGSATQTGVAAPLTTTTTAPVNQPETLNLSNNTPVPTVVVQSGNNSLLLVGFAIIALLVLVVVVLVLSLNNPTSTPLPATIPPTALAAVATDTTTPPTAPPAAPAVPTFGRISFSNDAALGDTAILRVENLAPPPTGQNYAVWLVNADSDDSLRLGSLVVDAFGAGVLTFTDNEGRLLPGQFNEVHITLEDAPAEALTADPVYQGRIPLTLSQALTEIFVASEAGHNGGSLLDGARGEADTARMHAGLAAQAGNIGGMRTHAEHTLNIINGTQEDLNGDGRAENPGRSRLGVFHFLDAMEQSLNAAINLPEATVRLQADGELIRVCLNNARLWLREIDTIEREMLAAESIDTVAARAAQARELAQAVLSGIDLNGNNTVDPFEGECGLDQIEVFGVTVGGIDIVEASPDS